MCLHHAEKYNVLQLPLQHNAARQAQRSIGIGVPKRNDVVGVIEALGAICLPNTLSPTTHQSWGSYSENVASYDTILEWKVSS